MQFNRPGQGVAIDTNGTSLQGYIDASYKELLDIFGEPESDCDSYKSDAEWLLRFKDGTIATIYNYKDGKNYLGNDGMPTEMIRNWHIGGFAERAVDRVKQTILEAIPV